VVKISQSTSSWLNQDQLAQLFNRDQSVISRHIKNVFNEGELELKSNMQKMHTPNSDKPVAFFNLDVIISVGYRVKSKQGTQFRIWATNVLRDYLLKGYAFNQRMDRIENNFENLSKEVKQISLQLKTQELPNQGIFFDGQIFDAYVFASGLIKKANEQFGNFEIQELQSSHDRFLIIDGKELYHLGASLKDLGKKWFAFSKMEMLVNDVLLKLPTI
jgi:hypothetical protein